MNSLKLLDFIKEKFPESVETIEPTIKMIELYPPLVKAVNIASVCNSIDKINNALTTQQFNTCIISAHGIRNNNNYVVINKNIKKVVPMTDINTGLQMNTTDYSRTCNLLASNCGKDLYTNKQFKELYGLKTHRSYKTGCVMENLGLDFFMTHEEDNTYTRGGIYTTGKFRDKQKSINDMSIKDIIMKSTKHHDRKILTTEELLDSYTLADILNKIGNIYKGKKVILSACRSNKKHKPVPSFFTLGDSSEYMFENFIDKLTSIEQIIESNDYSKYSTKLSKLKLNTGLKKLVEVIQTKINKDGIIDTCDFHSVVEIYNGQIIPNDCVSYGISRWLESNIPFVDNYNIGDIIIGNDLDKRFFLNKLKEKFKKYLKKMVLNNEIDYIIKSISLINNKQSIMKQLYDGIIH